MDGTCYVKIQKDEGGGLVVFWDWPVQYIGVILTHVATHDILVWFLWMAHRNVTVCVNDPMIVQDVVGSDDLALESNQGVRHRGGVWSVVQAKRFSWDVVEDE